MTKAKYDFCTNKVLSPAVGHAPDELEVIAGKLAKAGVNINYVYGTGAAPKATIMLGVSDVDAAAKALG